MSESRLGEVLARAQEIDGQTRHMEITQSEIETFVTAAEESGLSRDAVMQALRERLGYAPDAFQEGELVFAKSEDGHFYAARISDLEGKVAKVRFLNGGFGMVAIGDLRLFSLAPGQSVQYDSPAMYTWVTARVQSVNLEGGSVRFNMWGTPETVPLEKVRLAQERTSASVAQTTKYWTIGLSSLLTGTALGGAITWWLTRR